MPNEYSIEIHNYLNDQIEAAQDAISNGSPDIHLQQGRLEQLFELRTFLQENIDLQDHKYF